jgi:hypothetical protein
VKYMPEFVQHHKNVGFEQIVIGFIADLGSSEMIGIQQRLASYIEEGTVVLAAATAPGMDCGTELLKVAFYQSCLYHSKGTSEYVGIWDIDEFWVPSPSFRLLPPDTETSSADRSTAISPLLLNDPLWKESQYAERYSVTQAMNALKTYQQYYGCSDMDWCFHSFPSYTVHRKQRKHKQTRRTDLITQDFERRDAESNQVWIKSIAKTKNTFLGGYHEFGSCRLGNSSRLQNPGENETLRKTPYNNSDEQTNCRNLRIDGFGNLDHFMNLIRKRGSIPHLDKTYPRNDYVKSFGRTVKAQLKAASG